MEKVKEEEGATISSKTVVTGETHCETPWLACCGGTSDTTEAACNSVIGVDTFVVVLLILSRSQSLYSTAAAAAAC